MPNAPCYTAIHIEKDFPAVKRGLRDFPARQISFSPKEITLLRMIDATIHRSQKTAIIIIFKILEL